MTEFTYQSKVYAWEGKLRKATVRVGEMPSIAVWKEWQVAMLKLNGRDGTFYMQDPIGAVHRGIYNLASPGAPLVAGGNQNGPDLTTDGWPVSLAGMLKAGDFIAIQGRLYQLMADATSSAGGLSTLQIWPHATPAILDNAVITVGINAFGTFRLLEFPAFVYDVERCMTGFAFACEEAF